MDAGPALKWVVENVVQMVLNVINVLNSINLVMQLIASVFLVKKVVWIASEIHYKNKMYALNVNHIQQN